MVVVVEVVVEYNRVVAAVVVEYNRFAEEENEGKQ